MGVKRGEVWWADLPAEVQLGPNDGLPRACVANLDTILTIAKSSLDKHVTDLSPEKLRAIDAALRFALGLED